MIIDALLISNEFLFSSLSKPEVAEYFNQLSSTSTKIQVSANKKMEALSNPDMLDIEESPEAQKTRCLHMSSLGWRTSRETQQSLKAWVWQEGQANSCMPPFNVKPQQKKSNSWTVMRLALLHLIECSSVNNNKNASIIINKQSMIYKLHDQPCVTPMLYNYVLSQSMC